MFTLLQALEDGHVCVCVCAPSLVSGTRVVRHQQQHIKQQLRLRSHCLAPQAARAICAGPPSPGSCDSHLPAARPPAHEAQINGNVLFLSLLIRDWPPKKWTFQARREGDVAIVCVFAFGRAKWAQREGARLDRLCCGSIVQLFQMDWNGVLARLPALI